MHLDAPRKVLDRLKQDNGLAVWMLQNLPGQDLTFSLGLKPDDDTGTAMAVDEFPYIAVSPLSETLVFNDRNARARVSIMYGLSNDNRSGDDDGLSQVSALGLLILEALDAQPLGTAPIVVWDKDAEIRSDAGLSHPYYEGEIIINVEVRRAR